MIPRRVGGRAAALRAAAAGGTPSRPAMVRRGCGAAGQGLRGQGLRSLSRAFSQAAAAAARPLGGGKVELEQGNNLAFDHVQMYVGSLRPLSEYRQLEADMAALGGGITSAVHAPEERQALAERWEAVAGAPDAPFSSFGQDVVEQMIVGAGWRVVASATGATTETVLVRSADPRGVRFVVTAPRDPASLGACMPDHAVAEVMAKADDEAGLDHFAKHHVDRFLSNNAGRPGVAVLAFEVQGEGTLDGIAASYGVQHAALCVAPIHSYGEGAGRTRVLEVFAYYAPEGEGAADEGTVLRFVERATAGVASLGDDSAVLPGLVPVSPAPVFLDEGVTSSYCDHWVSNVVDRTGFLDTLNDTLGFSPKVDFNAGVVAAGEAIIESTVTGNTPPIAISATDAEAMLINQQQIFLPTNNALSEVGHVAAFIEQLGQGIQHIASRVPDLVSFIHRANTYREVTQKGLVFLNIPRSYYGRLSLDDLSKATGGDETAAEAALAAVTSAGLVDEYGIVSLDLAPGAVSEVLSTVGNDPWVADAAAVVERARYSNLYGLLKDHLTEAQYIEVVRNQILVDIQGEDCLYQIFTAPVLNAAPGEEAPFLEFIQRVCSNRYGPDGTTPLPVKPGCGGFGIRNFLTLFLSIELQKSANALVEARSAGDASGVVTADAMVSTLTNQLNVSNPVLTAISDAMTLEGEALEQLETCEDEGERSVLMATVEEWRRAKEMGNQQLQAISDEHKELMAAIRNNAA